jgi:hypothetical protein
MATKHQIHDLKRMLIREQNNFNLEYKLDLKKKMGKKSS